MKMIYSLTGKIQSKLSNAVIINVNDIGFLVYTTFPILASINIGDDKTFYTHFHVREDQMSLAGFLDEEHLKIFEKIISVSGVGIKAGLAILSGLNLEEIKNAIEKGQTAPFEKISGIGKKTSQKIILELKGKIDFNQEEPISDSEAAEALLSLGYNRREAIEALKKVDKDLSVEDKIREALKKV